MNVVQLKRILGVGLLLFIAGLSQSAGRQDDPTRPALIPQPQTLHWNGEQYQPGNENRLVQRLVDRLPEVPGNTEEAYRLSISADSAILEATTQKGLFRGMQTVRQLTHFHQGKQVIAGCSIVDWPAFAIRGFMQDVGRNYMPVSLLKEQIDVMAAYKFNVFHFHVTDNPAWRLGSRRYPELSEASSMTRWPGKFYRQEEFRDLLAYCDERFITLIPEFDIPGHSEAFRKAFVLDSMSDPRVQPILLNLIDELCGLAPAEKMPFVHLGTDEVWHAHERPAPGLLSALVERVKQHGREVIVWRPGQSIEGDDSSITQLWSSGGSPKPGHRYLDSRLNYLNHLDPLAGIAQLYFDRICGAAQGDSLRLGGILCCWNDNLVADPNDIIRHNSVYPGMLTYSETSWTGQPVEPGEEYLAKLPAPGNPLYEHFQDFEERLCRHRDRYFKGKPFPYVKQTQIVWSLLGPFDHEGDLSCKFPVEKLLGNPRDFKQLEWTGPYYGGTIHINHFFGYPSHFSEKEGTIYAATAIWSPKKQEVDCWIGFHDWSRSGGRRGGSFPEQGKWHNTDPKIWLNGLLVVPPVWNNPGLAAQTEMIPFEDENYAIREPLPVTLRKGWNRVVLKIPHGESSWKWMFTFVPVRMEADGVREAEDLKFSVNKLVY